jgi:hypothetical protein
MKCNDADVQEAVQRPGKQSRKWPRGSLNWKWARGSLNFSNIPVFLTPRNPIKYTDIHAGDSRKLWWDLRSRMRPFALQCSDLESSPTPNVQPIDLEFISYSWEFSLID